MKKATQKKNLIYVSSEGFFDVDLPIIKELRKHYRIKWLAILNKQDRFDKNYITRYCLKYDIKYRLLLKKYRLRNPLIVFFYLKIIKEIIKFNPDIIYLEYLGPPYFHILTKIFLDDNKIIIAVHDVEMHSGEVFYTMRNLYKKFVFKTFKNFHFFSESQKNFFLEKYPNKKYFVGKMFLKDFGRTSVTKSKKIINFLFFGTIRHNKGLDYLLKAVDSLGDKYSNFNLTIAGECNDWKYYESIISKKNLLNLNIRQIPSEEIPDLFGSAHYLVLPYRDVTQSGPLLIAYNYNVPIIASNLPGFREYIEDGFNGFLFRSENVESLSHCLENVIIHHDGNYVQLRKNLCNFIKKEIQIKSIIKNYCDFFETLPS